MIWQLGPLIHNLFLRNAIRKAEIISPVGRNGGRYSPNNRCIENIRCGLLTLLQLSGTGRRRKTPQIPATPRRCYCWLLYAR